MAAAAVSSAKRSLRAELKRRLRALSAEERLRQSRLLAQKVGERDNSHRNAGPGSLQACVFTHSQYQKSKRISIFLSMQDEIETEEIIKDIFQQGKTCFIPRYQFQSNHMDMVKLASPEEISSLPKTSWNIHQPSEVEVREEALSTGGLDLIFMPGLGFDKHGNRLGRGKGYYDAYLKRCLQSQDVRPYTLALAFKEQICLQVPVDENDMKVDEVLYEDSSAS
ncbi:5-formyltetrahydrofolate cyclo-ligase isoform X1 [Delphinus delphis]|uniref:5-formyltetrahydrofolate cyclo-ligase n=4 Tax=Cetacea TaxID=9721 RepID=A0A6J3R0F5_TURTR|nr:5-formyltetrahydrofolate cyclo-ligase isoform X1 [Tursiops truncatus]XP_059861300.1 5-formyltetrahydrofolate cyclo-ligase isoform X1 [Delphinus delphis]